MAGSNGDGGGIVTVNIVGVFGHIQEPRGKIAGVSTVGRGLPVGDIVVGLQDSVVLLRAAQRVNVEGDRIVRIPVEGSKGLVVLIQDVGLVIEQRSSVPDKISVIVDTVTGVNYLFVEHGNGAGLTPLIDENGKPIVTRVILDN